ncbi:hypothetical protein JCM10212_000237 [Sporobolomyces blumeae]
MATTQPSLSPLPPSFQPRRTRSHRLSLGSRKSFSSSSFSSPASFGASLLKTPPMAHLADKQRNRRITGSTRKAKSGLAGAVAHNGIGQGPKRESWLRHGHSDENGAPAQLVSSSTNRTTRTGSFDPVKVHVNLVGLGEPINLDAALARRTISTPRSASVMLNLPKYESPDRLSPLASPSKLSPPSTLSTISSSSTSSSDASMSSPLDPTTFGASLLSNGFGSSRRHSRLGMLKHRTKSLATDPFANATTSASILPRLDGRTSDDLVGSQHPRSPSIDITSVFHSFAAEPTSAASSLPTLSSLAAIPASSSDAFELFDEAFPFPSPSVGVKPDASRTARVQGQGQVEGRTDGSPALVEILSPSLRSARSASEPTTTSPSAESMLQGVVSTPPPRSFVPSAASSSSSSSTPPKGLRELELVKRRLSWESIGSASVASSSADTIVAEAETGTEVELSEEERFEDALEAEDAFGNAMLPVHPPATTLSPVRRSTVPVSSANISPISLGDTSPVPPVGLGLGLGLGIDLVEPEQPRTAILSTPSSEPLVPSSSSSPSISIGPHPQLQALSFDEMQEGSDALVGQVKGLGIGLGLNRAIDERVKSAEASLGLGLGLDFGEAMKRQVERARNTIQKRTVGDHMDEAQVGAAESQEQLYDFADPASPMLDAVSTPVMVAPPSPKTISPRRQHRSPPRAKKVSRPLLLNLPNLSKAMKGKMPAQVKRIYPRPHEAELGRKIKEAKMKATATAAPSQEEVYYGSPNLSDLPGSFLASPVLPTSFADFSHSPLPTPPNRFARMRRGGQQQTAPLPDYAVTHAALSPTLPTTTPGTAQGLPSWSTSSSTSVYCPPSSTASLGVSTSVPASPLGTPTLAASPAFSPSLSDMSAPSTPVPDQVNNAAASAPVSTETAGAAAAAGTAGQATTPTGEMNQQLFDAAIASTILGAIVCIGAVSWLAFAVFKKKMPGSKKTYSSRGIGSDDTKRFSDDLDDEKIRASPYSSPASGRPAGSGGDRRGGIAARGISAPILTDLPKPPPLARLSFPPSSQAGEALAERSFSSHFDAWVDASTRRALAGASTEDHGGYPEEAVRGDGMSTVERRMSRASRVSTQSFGSKYPRSTNRSSYRSSTGPSIVDSTWSTRPGTAYSSRTSHHDPKEYGVDSLPPQLPSPVLRNSVEASDVAAYFAASSPDTPTRVHRSYMSDNEPPVPSLPSDYRDLSASAPPVIKTRARATSRSNGCKSATARSGYKATTAMKTMPALNSIVTSDEGHESPTEAALRKLEKRRATVDGGILADGLQALLFQAHLDSPTKGLGDSTTEEKPDIFSTSAGGVGSAQIKRNSVTSSVGSGSGIKAAHKSPKKTRPQTMPHLPPTIVVSDHPNAAAPPTPSRTRTTTSDSGRQTDPRSSVKTFENLPWLAHSPSTNFSVHPRDDAGSVIDPEMRSIRHFSVDTNRFSVDSMPLPPKRFSKDFASLSNRSAHTVLDSIDIASRRLASEDDLASQGSVHENDAGHDTDDEEAKRTQRRKTLLYSVYKQRGVDLSPTSPASTAPTGQSPGSLTTLSRTSLSEDSNVDTPTKGAARDALVASFPSPPPMPDPTGFASLVANLESTMDAAASLAGDRSSSVAPHHAATSSSTKQSGDAMAREGDIGVAQFVAEDNARSAKKSSSARIPAPPVSSAFAPPRPPKSPIRMSVLPDADSEPTAPSSRIALPSRQAARQPFASVNGNIARAAPSSASTAVSKPTTVSAPPVRSFAAELQESVGNPAEGYDSDTLMSGLAFNKPGRSFFAPSSTAGGFSTSSSGYGFASTMYSTNPGSLESLEEVVAISQAETVQFGRSRASGIPQFSWRRNHGASSGIGQYDSEESAYEESDAETAMFRARMEPIAE